MEAAYGIGVQNRYALFLEDDDSADPYALLTTVASSEPPEPKKGLLVGSSFSKSNTSTAVKSASSGPTSTVPPKLANQQASNKSSTLSETKQNATVNQKSEGGRQNRSRPANQQQRLGNRENQENRTQRSPRNFESKDNDGSDYKSSKELRNEKVENRRNGFTRGSQRGRGDRGRLSKREFNRHSGSDRSSVKSTEKREGGGSHNWGKIDDFSEQPLENELVNGEKSIQNENEKSAEEGIEGEVAAGDNAENAETEPKIDKPQLKTLDEYKRELEEKRVHTQFNIRKPGEGEDKSKWKKTYVLKKKPVAEEEEVEFEEIEVEEDTNKRRNRQVLDIKVSFRPVEDGREVTRRGRSGRGGSGVGKRNDPERGRGGNSGSGPPRGPQSGSRGVGRGRDRNRFQPAPKFDDLNDFPSLSS